MPFTKVYVQNEYKRFRNKYHKEIGESNAETGSCGEP